ncbi:MAG: ferredoxin reductase, partial [Mycobacterium sp.]|nr:ferredoxin reductase [Mycobacterium sp.]
MSRQTATGEATPTLRMLGHMARGYSRIFTESSWADRLSPASQVCRSGFDARLEVVGVQTVAADVMVITLCRPDRSPLPSWTPGAHIDVFTPTGRQRHYSLIGSPFDRLRYRIAVRKIPHGVGSAELHQLQVGEHLQVRGPRNAFNLASADEYLFLAGGIGITPILPMVQAVSARTNRWRLIYTGSSRDAMPFADELVAIDDDRVDIRPDDRHGVPDIEGLLAGISSRTALYVCGPIAMIDRARQVADQRAPASEVHSERFGAPPVINARSFAVNLARSGI